MKKVIFALLMLALTELPLQAQTATYYSSHYQGKRTASGARFSHSLPMAAHPSLPLGTRVRVTNPNTGKSVVVQIVDRCRCSLDLSQSAFRQIGHKSSGRIPVRLQVLR